MCYNPVELKGDVHVLLSTQGERMITKMARSRIPDLRQCFWWRPVTVAVVGEPADEAQRRLAEGLLAAFAEGGHQVVPEPSELADRVDVMLAFYPVPDSEAPLLDRVPERRWPLGLDLIREYNLKKRPENLITVVTVRERLSGLPHTEVLEVARRTAGRIGTPRVVFVSGDPGSGRVDEVTLCTLEGGHPTIAGEDWAFLVGDLANRLVALACAKEVGGQYRVVKDALSRQDWLASPVPDDLIEAGRRMDQLGLLPPQLEISQFVSPALARVYERFLNMKQFSEGTLCAWDPRLNLMMITGSGSWGVDKRRLKREEVVPIGGVSEEGVLVHAPEGMTTKGPSVETREFVEAFLRAPRVRLRATETGWAVDADGPVEAPLIRSIIHAHVGVVEVDERWVEHVAPNRRAFPYAFGCGTNLMLEVTADALSRSRALHDPEDPRAAVLWEFDNHGIAVAELWKGEPRPRAIQLTLDMFDPGVVGAIRYRPDEVVQV